MMKENFNIKRNRSLFWEIPDLGNITEQVQSNNIYFYFL